MRRKGEKISYYDTNKKIRSSIDRLLIESNRLSSNLGIDSTDEEKFIAKSRQSDINKEIIELDPYFFPGEVE